MALTWGPLGAGWTFVLCPSPHSLEALPGPVVMGRAFAQTAPRGTLGEARGLRLPRAPGGLRGQAGSGALSQHRRLWNASGLLCDPHKVKVKGTGKLPALPPSKATDLASERPPRSR